MAGEYPDNWKEIAEQVKRENDYTCERCGHEHDPEAGYCIGVHHLDGDKSNNARWNLACLCQRCHLHIQAKIKMRQLFWISIMGVSDWFKPHLEGFIKSKNIGFYNKEEEVYERKNL